MEYVKEILRKLSRGQDLTEKEVYALLEEFVEGRGTPAQMGAFIMATSIKGETPEEILGAVKFFRDRVVRVPLNNPEEAVDTAGTGGDASGTFNVSTVVGFVLAGAGVKVAKHGNRSVSSKSGSADFLERLGARLELSPQETGRIIEEVGFGFMFAPLYHPAMKTFASPRREVGVRSIFNVIGPLTNPAGVKRQVVGVFSEEYVEKIAKVLRELGVRKAFVVHGEGGLDEVSPQGKTLVAEVSEGEINIWEFYPEEVGIKPFPVESVRVSSPEESVKVALSVLKGESSPARDFVLLNAIFGILASGLTEDKKQALEMAKESIDSGRAYRKMKEFVEATKS